MSALPGEILKNCDDDSIGSLLGDGGVVCRDTISLVEQNGCLRMTVPADAWAGCQSLADPGSVDAYYFPERDVMVVDLDG